ncbi:TIR domain-containing protein [Aquimarina macrocephali]|uniref:TIR domain-containing protein n=1 Tax=Aquimarina macrocephali TaxID=666563 RepID=UPI003F66D7FC
MREEIKPEFEILYSDLKNHLIGDFLVSREFKMMMSKNGYYQSWQKTYENVKKNRGYLSIGVDHLRGDNIDTLALFINASNEAENIENVVTLIICSFIEYKKTNEDFEDVIEAMTVAKFQKSNVEQVLKVFDKHKNQNLPEKEIINSSPKKKTNVKKANEKEVFIVHGHNEELKEKVARTLEKLGLTPKILHEQSNEGLTVIEKFEKHSNVNFAVILLTYDDHGNIKSNNEKNKRARQNVILELGYFIAKISRKNVMPLYEKGVELPSDISGVLYTLIDETENWKFRLVKELKSAGYNVDANDIL